MSLLSIIQTVCAELSLAQPAMVIGSTDRQVQQFLAIANLAGGIMARHYPWQALRTEFTFAAMAQAEQSGAIPGDFDRWVPNSFFDRSTRRPITGPITPREWQWIQAQPVYSSVYLAFIQRGGEFLAVPNPAANDTIAFEYISTNWVMSEAGAPQALFEADTDTARIDETVLQLAVKWRYLRAKGLDYAEEMEDYERELERLCARDGGATAITLAPQPIDPNRINIPDGNYGV
jgi:hypothetical protein